MFITSDAFSISCKDYDDEGMASNLHICPDLLGLLEHRHFDQITTESYLSLTEKEKPISPIRSSRKLHLRVQRFYLLSVWLNPSTQHLALDLLKKCLAKNVSERITSAEALNHPFFTKMSQSKSTELTQEGSPAFQPFNIT